MAQERRDFLKFSSLVGALALVDAKATLAAAESKPKPLSGPELQPNPQVKSSCVLIPSETDGPFPLDLSANTAFFRRDIRESKTGVPLKLKLKILDANTCEPMPNVRVNIWHCDKDGEYSGYYAEAGQTYLRGYQIADSQGKVEFDTVFPGWYPGRICHIHFQVYVSTAYRAISQLTFPVAVKNALYAEHAALYTHGADPVDLAHDYLFSDGYAFQMATLTANRATGGYAAELEVSVDGKSAKRGHIELENAMQFELGALYLKGAANANDNKYEVVIPITIKNPSQVTLEHWSVEGRKLASESQPRLQAGSHLLTLSLRERGETDSGICQVVVDNEFGQFKRFQVLPNWPDVVQSV
jgi:protocatechuate 3,4-dioxygenase beta subunit